MQHTKAYSVGERVFNLPTDKVEGFLATAKANGDAPEEAYSYRVSGAGREAREFTIPRSKFDGFRAAAERNGDVIEPVRKVRMADGTERSFTMPEMSRFLRSDEYRKSKDYEAPQAESVTAAGVRGFARGLGEGAYGGANATANAIAKALPEAAIGVERAFGQALNLGGNARNRVGDWFVKDADDARAWLDAKVPSRAKEWTGYEDWATKSSDKVADVAAMAYKFAPAMATGGTSMGTAVMSTIFATDGVNAAADTFARAKENGYTTAEANGAAAASFLVNYYGGKALTKAGMTGGMNPVLAFVGRGAEMGNLMGLQAAANKGIENLTEGEDGKPQPKEFTDGMWDAYVGGQFEGNLFHYMNAVPGAVMNGAAAAKVKRTEREMRRESLLTAAESPKGAELIDGLLGGEGLETAIEARAKGENVSRKMGKAMDLPDNMSVEERNQVVDAVAGQRKAKEIETIKRRAAATMEKQAVAEERRTAEAKMDAEAQRKASMQGMEERAQRKAEMDEYERQEAERKAREAAEEAGAPEVGAEIAAEEARQAKARSEATPEEPKSRTEEWPEYAAWLKKQSRVDNDKNWNRFVMENELDPALKVERGRDAKVAKTEDEARAEATEPAMVEEKPAEVKAEEVKPVEAPKTHAEASVEESVKPIEQTAPKAENSAEPVSRDDYVSKAIGSDELLGKIVGDNKIPDVIADKIADAQKRLDEAKADYDAAYAKEKASGKKGRGWSAERKDANERISDIGRELAEAKKELIGALRGSAEPEKIANSAEEVKPVEATAEKVPDGKGGMKKKTSAEVDTTGLEAMIAEAKASGKDKYERSGKDKFHLVHGETEKDYEIKVGTTTIRFNDSPDSIARAEKLLAKIKNPMKDTKLPTAHVPAAPQPAKVAKVGSEAGMFDRTVSGPDGKGKNGKKIKGIAADFTLKDKRSLYMQQHLDKPIVQGEHIIATDRHVAFRMANTDKLPDTEGAADVNAFFTEKAMAGESVEIDPAALSLDVQRAKVTSKQDDVNKVELWLAKDGKIAVRSQIHKGEAGEASFSNVDTLKDARFVAEVNPEFLQRVLDAFPKIGDGKVKMSIRENSEAPLYFKGEHGDALVMPFHSLGELGIDELVQRKGGIRSITDERRMELLKGEQDIIAKRWKTDLMSKLDHARQLLGEGDVENLIANVSKRKGLTAKQRQEQIDMIKAEYAKAKAFLEQYPDEKAIAKASEEFARKVIEKSEAEFKAKVAKGIEDPLEAKNIEIKRTPEDEIAERLDLHRIKPKQRKDAKVLEWAKKRGRTITDGMVTPDALREYEHEQANGAAKLAKRWFPDMKVTYHDYGENIKRGQHVLDQLVEDEGIIKAFDNKDGTVTVYRAVQVNEKGEVRPPQSTRIEGADGKLIDRPAEGYVDTDGNIRTANGGPVVIRAEERPDLAHRVKGKDGEWKKFTEKDARDGKCPPEMVGEDKWFFDLKKAKGTGSTDNVVYDPYMHSSDTPLNDQFTSAWKRPDWRIAVGKVLKSDLESGYRAEKAGLSVGAHEWKGGAVDNQLSKDMKRKVFLTQHLKMERILPEAEAAKILKAKWGEMGMSLDIPDSRVSPSMRDALIKEGFKISKSGEVQYLHDRSGNTLGWFDPRNKEVHLLPGSNAETVAHEIMWHGTRDWATNEAGRGNATAQRLLNKMHEVERAVPAQLKKQIARAYRKSGVTDPDTLMNEYGAWDAMVNGGKALESALRERENARWYAKWWNAAKDMVKEYLANHGGNRTDLSQIDGMTTDEFKDYLAGQFAGGKTLGKIGASQGNGKAINMKESYAQRMRRKVYDVNAAIRDLERSIEKKNGVKIAFDKSAEAENALTPGLREAAKRGTDAAQRELREYLGGDNSHGKKLAAADLEYYMALKAAAGRDAKIDAKNLEKIAKDVERKLRAEWGTDKISGDPSGYQAAVDTAVRDAQNEYRSTNGSHIDPREARRILDEIEHGSDAGLYRDAAKLVRKVIDETLDIQVRNGLVSQELADKLKTEEPDYVPFKNEYDVETGEWRGRGVNNFYKPEFREARGRKSAAGDILTHIFQDNLSAKQRAIENAVRVKLAKLVQANGEVGTIEKLGEMAKNPEKTLSDTKDKINKTGDPNVVVFKMNGNSYAIRLNGTRGAAIAAGLTERNTKSVDDLPWYLGGEKMGKVARFSAGLATRYAPYFSLRNFPKDNIELGNIIYAERGPVEGTKWAAKYVANHAKNAKGIAKFVATGKIDDSTATGKLIKRWVDAGGIISGGATEGYANIKKSLSAESIEREMKRGKSKAWATFQTAKRAVAFANEMSEVSTRINAFATEVQSGKSDREAALFARRATVDFNRHGENTAVSNTLRLFSNSTLGATARSIAAIGKSKWGAAAITASFGIGALQEALNKYLNEEDDEEAVKRGNATGKDVSEYERKTSFFSVRKGDKVYKIAQHESPFSLANYAGQCAVRVMNGDMSAEDAAKNLGISVAEMGVALSGLGSVNLESREGGIANDVKTVAVSLAPTLLQPMAEIALDVDYKGDRLAKRRFGDETPRSENAKRHTPEYAKEIAKELNEMTGGNDARPGYFDMAPEAVQKIVEGYGKNAVREIAMTIELAKAAFNGKMPNMDARRIPIVRDVVRPVDGNTDRFYKAMDAYEKDVNDYEKHRSTWSMEERKAFANAHPWVKKSNGSRKIDRWVNGWHNGAHHVPGIKDLYKMEDGKKRTNSGKFIPAEFTQEQIDGFKKKRLELQARVLKAMGQ